MSPLRKKRLAAVVALMLGFGAALFFVLQALNENMMFYYSPTEVKAGGVPTDRLVRVGGMVKPGSIKRLAGSMKVMFVATDFAKEVTIAYEGILPDLFREGQGVIARGYLRSPELFEAIEVLAKHDESYMPPEVAASLKKPVVSE
jgi:cytochrome c-type biogenesis protein CcmE